MGFGILHLSDMHFKDGAGGRLSGRAPAIGAAMRPRCAHLEALLLIVSGDITYSGKKSEFRRAEEFINAILGELRSQKDLEVLGPVLVPGNHDCDFLREGDVRPSLLGSLPAEIKDIKLEGDRVRHIVAPLEEFFAFERGYSGSEREGPSRLYYARQFKFRESAILVHCFNTAWVSRVKEQQGQILFPMQVSPLKSSERPALSVSVFHAL